MTAVPLFAKAKATQVSTWLARGQNEIFTVATYLTPDLARQLLAKNDNNRPVQFKGSGGTRSVPAYAAAMKRGEWVMNGEPIIVARTGELNDGQHRCYAAMEADAVVPVLITFGVERDTRHTVDQGIARSPGAILSMAGEVNCHALGSALQMLCCIDQGSTLNYRPSIDQVLATLERHPDIREAVTAVMSLATHYHLSQGYLAGAHYLASRHDTWSADQFLGALTTGLHIQSLNSPVARLRKQFEEHNAKRKRIGRDEQAALYIKGFNNYCKGKLGPIAWRNTGPAAEAFPVVGA